MCGRSRAVKFFRRRARSADGFQASCKTCQADYDKSWYEANKIKRRGMIRARNLEANERNKEWVASYLLAHPCVDCGEDDLVTLDFDHVCGGKVDSVTELLNTYRSLKRIKEEVGKCEVRCANCHRKRHAATHPTWRSKYSKKHAPKA